MSTTQASPRLRVTREYNRFVFDNENRPVDLPGHKKLMESMKKFGFIPAYPVHCTNGTGDRLTIVDGQHRVATAQKLGLPIWYVVCEEHEKLSIADINGTQKPWAIKDYAESFASQGMKDYAELLDFSKQYGVPITTAVGLLMGRSACGNSLPRYYAGEFKVKEREQAAKIAGIYSQFCAMSKRVRNNNMINAIYAACLVPGFEPQRLLEGATRCPEKLISYSTREAYLMLVEDLYNFGRRQRVPLKIPAENAMRERSIFHNKALLSDGRKQGLKVMNGRSEKQP